MHSSRPIRLQRFLDPFYNIFLYTSYGRVASLICFSNCSAFIKTNLISRWTFPLIENTFLHNNNNNIISNTCIAPSIQLDCSEAQCYYYPCHSRATLIQVLKHARNFFFLPVPIYLTWVECGKCRYSVLPKNICEVAGIRTTYPVINSP